MNLADIKRRVASMEEDCQAEIPDGSPLPMTAHVVVEARWLTDSLLSLRRHSSKGSRKIEDPLREIDERVKKLESRHRSSIEIGKFVQLSTAIIPDMRYLVDEIEKYTPKRKASEPTCPLEDQLEAEQPEAPALA